LKDLYIIDGYNFIFNDHKRSGPQSCSKDKKIVSDELSSLRENLISELSQFKSYNNCDVVVVFDAKNTTSNTETSGVNGSVIVIFSKKDQTADTIVEKMVHENEDYEKIFVVTSDYLQQKVVFRKNIYRKSVNEFMREIKKFKVELSKKINDGKDKRNTTFYSIEKRLNIKELKRLKDIIYGRIENN
jgi:predicted RNA-binding protein with PIN domain